MLFSLFNFQLALFFVFFLKFQICQGEQCRIDDNSQKGKWKVANKNNEIAVVPSVCFILEAVDQDSIDAFEKYSCA